MPASGIGFIHNSKRPNPEARFGTYELLSYLSEAAQRMQHAKAGQPLYINDIGLEHGGPIVHHGSHQAGRDVDVLFFLLDKDGNPREPKGIPLDPKGEGWDFQDLLDPKDDVFVKFDTERTWAFIQAFIESAGSYVQRLFIVEHLRSLLLEEAKRVAAPKHIVDIAEAAMCQPSVAHDDHLHIRVFCDANDIKQGCRDGFPIYPWHLAHLRSFKTKPVIATRHRKKSKTISAKEAHAKAGPMHAKVEAFLEQQLSWSSNPHPGRRWCR
ncbi:MAG: penicillin-insensitive murein endopeptidase [Myxococcales bacterium]|nr:MAG: penicillin-insensitive murein endopeptidase [Myxococcales bacterium]